MGTTTSFPTDNNVGNYNSNNNNNNRKFNPKDKESLANYLNSFDNSSGSIDKQRYLQNLLNSKTNQSDDSDNDIVNSTGSKEPQSKLQPQSQSLSNNEKKIRYFINDILNNKAEEPDSMIYFHKLNKSELIEKDNLSSEDVLKHISRKKVSYQPLDINTIQVEGIDTSSMINKKSKRKLSSNSKSLQEPKKLKYTDNDNTSLPTSSNLENDIDIVDSFFNNDYEDEEEDDMIGSDNESMDKKKSDGGSFKSTSESDDTSDEEFHYSKKSNVNSKLINSNSKPQLYFTQKSTLNDTKPQQPIETKIENNSTSNSASNSTNIIPNTITTTSTASKPVPPSSITSKQFQNHQSSLKNMKIKPPSTDFFKNAGALPFSNSTSKSIDEEKEKSKSKSNVNSQIPQSLPISNNYATITDTTNIPIQPIPSKSKPKSSHTFSGRQKDDEDSNIKTNNTNTNFNKTVNKSINSSNNNNNNNNNNTTSNGTSTLVFHRKNKNTLDINVPNDGFSWRKYGQKSVKGEELPKHYYKCTFKDCKAKKYIHGNGPKVEYKGEHNHEITALDQENDNEPKNKQINNIKVISIAPDNKQSDPHNLVETGEEEIVNMAGNFDGYQWKRYGTKPFKGSKYPKIYMRCVYPDCQVTRQLVQSSDTSFHSVYSGTHKHPPPENFNNSTRI